jgi:hypothetical protein
MVPCVLFAFNRPDKFARIVSAIRPQNVDHIIVFIDGPRDDRDNGPIEECKKIAASIDWVGVDRVFKEKNEGLAGINKNINNVFLSYDSAVFIEDDCLPMPSFYPVMKRALQHYRDDERVFSIGGYQQIPEDFFRSYPYSFVSSARFICWGWATWKDRWQQVSPYFSANTADLKGYRNIPDIAGDDLVLFARTTPLLRKRLWEAFSWDIKVAVLALYLKKVHLLTSKGLIKNIGLDAGIHFTGDEANEVFYNRNVYEKRITGIRWLEDTALNDEYNRRLKAAVDTARDYFSKKAAARSFTGNSMTLPEIIASAPSIINQLRERPLRTTKKIILRILRRPIRALFNN